MQVCKISNSTGEEGNESARTTAEASSQVLTYAYVNG